MAPARPQRLFFRFVASDGAGSIRIPAAVCGLVGLKPTRGRTAEMAEAAQLPVNIHSNGVVTRTVTVGSEGFFEQD